MGISVKITGAQAILLSLLEEQVDTVFGYPGGAIIPLYDRLYDKCQDLKHVLVRHEQGAAHAAQAYAQVTGKTGVCFATSGPGATNLITGITNAHLDSVPVVFITAQVPFDLLGSDAFQETDMISLSMPVTKWNFQITEAGEIPEGISKAFFIAATGRPGPVLLDITKNAQLEEFEFHYRKTKHIRSYVPRPFLEEADLRKATALINDANKPLLLAGHGILSARAHEELTMFASKANIPVAVTLLGKSVISEDHPCYVGMLGMHGNYAPNMLTNKADLIIAAGMRFDDRVTGLLERYAPQARIIHIDIDKSELNKNIKVDLAIHADIKDFFTRVIPWITKAAEEAWLHEFRKLQQVEKTKVIDRECFPKTGKIRAGEVVRMLSEKTNGEATIVTDVGQNQMMGARYYQFRNANSLITSGGLGTMGFGLPAAVGAQVGRPGETVILFTGDGGFQMTVQELGTVFQYGLPVKMVIFKERHKIPALLAQG